MVEAMARALPCIGTRVGGIPELLEEEDLVPPGDPIRLAGKIAEVLNSGTRLAAMSKGNLAKAAEYRDDWLAPRRNDFYHHVRNTMHSWLSGGRLPLSLHSSL
jgi:glycosyltransferase involved in cell wall biosynthesis